MIWHFPHKEQQKSNSSSFPPDPCSVASVFSSVCDVCEGRRGSFVERIVSLLENTR